MTINQFLEKYYSLEMQMWGFTYPKGQSANQHFKEVKLDTYRNIAYKLNISFEMVMLLDLITELDAFKINNKLRKQLTDLEPKTTPDE